MNIEEPRNGFLENVKALTAKNGAVLVFDEMITGFRFSNGGAQELFGATPDLATFGKGLANGFPLSAVTGKKEIMMLMEEVFFSFTYGGETLSLAAALATMQKLERGSVIPFFMSLADTGVLSITDKRMTRFMISLEQGVELVWHVFVDMQGGEIYVKKIPSMGITDYYPLELGDLCHRFDFDIVQAPN